MNDSDDNEFSFDGPWKYRNQEEVKNEEGSEIQLLAQNTMLKFEKELTEVGSDSSDEDSDSEEDLES